LTAVIALPKELDTWLKQCSMIDARLTNMQYFRVRMALQVHQEKVGKLHSNLQILMEKIAEAKRVQPPWPWLERCDAKCS
jgi:hypothetical protein